MLDTKKSKNKNRSSQNKKYVRIVTCLLLSIIFATMTCACGTQNNNDNSIKTTLANQSAKMIKYSLPFIQQMVSKISENVE